MPEVFVDYLKKYLADISNRINLAACPVVISELYPDSIVLGAARLVPKDLGSWCLSDEGDRDCGT